MHNAIRTTLALALAAPVAVIGAQTPANADPCMFTAAEFSNWYDGARWGDTLGHVENAYANCTGTWHQTPATWNGHPEKQRIWPRPDGGQTKMNFAWYSGAGEWRAHDTAETTNNNISGTPQARVECEWPRGDNGNCSEIHTG